MRRQFLGYLSGDTSDCASALASRSLDYNSFRPDLRIVWFGSKADFCRTDDDVRLPLQKRTFHSHALYENAHSSGRRPNPGQQAVIGIWRRSDNPRFALVLAEQRQAGRMKWPPRIVASVIAGILIAGAVVSFAIAWRPTIAAIDPPAPQSFDADLVRRGRDLVAIGNCSDCHTVRGGKSFAGGLPVLTPFGTIFSSNITPDTETGIGRWSEVAFRRAMRSGVNRDGQHLYPTFPYDHFTNVTDEDDHALYAYLMTREPFHAPARKNEHYIPLDQRL